MGHGDQKYLHPEDCRRPETRRNPQLPGRECFDDDSAEQGTSEAEHSDRSAKHSPRTPQSASTTWSSVFSKSSIKAGLENLNCIPPIFSNRSGNSRPSGRGNRRIPRAKTDPSPMRKSTPSAAGHNTIAADTADAVPHKPMQRPNTFPRETSMREPSNNLQELRTRLLARAATTKIFNKIWETKILPGLQETMKKEHNGDYSITVQFDYQENQRIVEVMTEVELSTDIDQKLRNQVSPDFDDPEEKADFEIGLQCIVGTVKRSTGHSATIHDHPEDGWMPPANTMAHSSLKLGDSVGVENGDSATTLGPAIEFKGNIGFMVSCHLFDGKPEWQKSQDVRHPSAYRIVHPSPIDRTPDREPREIARLHAHSGPMYKSNRYSRTLRQFTEVPDSTHVVTDWAVCLANPDHLKLENRLRYVPDGREFEKHSRLIPGIWKLSPQLNIVRSTGRSSGIRYGVVGEVPSLVLQSGIPTREWYVENNEGILSTDLWNSGGIGMPGDSGAAILEDVSGRLIGQVWGRNVYGGDPAERRITYFTHIQDVFDDVRDRYPDIGYPQLLGQKDSIFEPQVVDGEMVHNIVAAEPEVDGTTLSSSVMRSRAHSSATDRQNIERKGSHSTFIPSTRSSSELNAPTNRDDLCSAKTIDGPQFPPGSNLGIPIR